MAKSLMLISICNGDPTAAAILDYVSLYFQQPNPYKIFFCELRRGYEDIISNGSYQYIRESHTPYRSLVWHRDESLHAHIHDQPARWLQ
jgi:hypothetical protein